MLRENFSKKLTGEYGGFHDSKVKQICIDTRHQIVNIVIDHAYDDRPSETGELVVPDSAGGSPKRFEILFRPATIIFKGVRKIEVTPELEPHNEELILDCEVKDDKGEHGLGGDCVHVEILFLSLSRMHIFCTDFEYQTSESE